MKYSQRFSHTKEGEFDESDITFQERLRHRLKKLEQLEWMVACIRDDFTLEDLDQFDKRDMYTENIVLLELFKHVNSLQSRVKFLEEMANRMAGCEEETRQITPLGN